jgi:DNA-binding transcriptional MerR regulator
MHGKLRRPERTFTIRQLCLEFKCTSRALRHYEAKGLLSPGRRGLERVYSYRDRARVRLILRGKRVSLSLAEIGEILDLYDKGDGCAVQNATALRHFRERLVALEGRRQAVDEAITELRLASERLEAELSDTRPDLLPEEVKAAKPQKSAPDVRRPIASDRETAPLARS